MNTQKDHRTSAAFMVLFLLMGFFLLDQFAKEKKLNNIFTLIKSYPLTLLILVVPLIMFLFYVGKANDKEEILRFCREHLFGYISKFMGFIITAYLAYYIIIPYEIKSLMDAIVLLIVILCAFLIFLLSCWLGENIPKKPLTKKLLIKGGIDLLRPILLITIPTIVITTIYWLCGVSINNAVIIGFLHSLYMILGFAPAIKDRRKKIISVLVIGISQPLFLYLFVFFGNLMSNIMLFICASVIGIVLTYLCLLYALFSNKESCFNKFLEKINDN